MPDFATPQRHHERRRRLGLLFSLLFALVISLPLALHLLGAGPRPVPLGENRQLAQKPALARTPATRWPGLLDAWFRDRLPFRSQLVAAYLRLWECVLEAPRNLSITGRQGERFCQCKGSATVERYLGVLPLSREHLARLKVGYAGMQAFFQLHGVRYVVINFPDKTVLYPEWLPAWSTWRRGQSTHDQLVASLSGTPIHYVDLLPVLAAGKAGQRLYDQRYDVSHWNGYGLDLAYRAIGEIVNGLGIPVDRERLCRQYAVVQKPVGLFSLGNPTVPVVRYAKSQAVLASDELPPIPSLFGWDRPRLLRNAAVPAHTIWVTTDSYIAGTHGSTRLPLTPFVREYIQFSFLYLTIPIAERLLQEHKPDVVLECFVDRLGGNAVRADDPVVRMLGDALLGTPGYVLQPVEVLRLGGPGGVGLTSRGETAVLGRRPETAAVLSLPPVVADADGRAVLMANLAAPAATVARLRFVPEGEASATPREVTATLVPGENALHLTMFTRPGTRLRAWFEPGEAPGEYAFLPMPRVQRVREMARGF